MSPFRIVAWALPLTLLTALAVVLATEERRSGHAGTTRAEVAVDDAGFPRTVVTPDGSEVRLPRAPRRVLVANTSLVDVVTALVGPARIAALPRQAATWSRLARGDTACADVPRFDAFVAEAVLAREPDLVLCSVHSQPESVDAVRDAGVPTVRFGFPETLDAVRDDLRTCAELLGAEARLAEIDADMDARIAALRAAVGARGGVRAAFYTHDGNEGWSSGGHTIADEILGLCGMQNATTAAGHVGAVRLTFEQLLATDADVLVIPEAFGEVDATTDRALRDEPALKALRAVREGHVVRLHPSLFSTTSQELVTAAEQLAAKVDALLGAEHGGK